MLFFFTFKRRNAIINSGSGHMHKKIIIPKNIKQVQTLSPWIDGVLLPLRDYSMNYVDTYTLDEIDDFIENTKEVFILMNKNFHHDELQRVKDVCEQLNKKNIAGIFFYDLAIVHLKMQEKVPLIWDQEHLTTNYLTMNYWYEKGIDSVHISSEITKDEIIEIQNQTKNTLFMTVFGYVPIFTSQRNLVKNYINTFHLQTSKEYKIEKDGKKYPIIDQKEGTFVYHSHILDIREEIQDLKIDYWIYNANEIEESIFEEVIKNDKKIENSNLGFLYQETIYKVKK